MTIRHWKPESIANTTILGSQQFPAVLGLPDGGYVVAWNDEGTDQATAVARFRIFNADGTPRTGEISVSGSGHSNVALSGTSTGGFILSYDDQFNSTDIDPEFDVYDAQGVTQLAGITYDSGTGVENLTATAPDGNGHIAVWVDNDLNGGDIEFRRYDASGQIVENTFTVNTLTTGRQTKPDVATLKDGNFIVVWEDESGLENNGDESVRARLISPNGSNLGIDFLVASSNTFLANPHVVALENGGFVVTYTVFDNRPFPSQDRDVYAKIYAPDGTQFGSEILVNSQVSGEQLGSNVVATSDGGFLVAWMDWRSPQGQTIKVQKYTGLGQPVDGEFIVNTGRTTLDRPTNFGNIDGLDRTEVAVSELADGRIVVAWTENTPSLGDGSRFAVKQSIIDPRDGNIVGTGTSDTVYGSFFGDTINLFDGFDTAFGLQGNDWIFGGGGNDVLVGGAGMDALYGGEGLDIASYQDATSAVAARLDGLAPGFGDGVGDFYSSIEGLTGSDFDDFLVGDDQVNVLRGGDGNDTMFGQGGGDILLGADGDDHLDGGAGVDQLFGDSGKDRLDGGSENDELDGGADEDIISGGTGDDFINGGAGGDQIDGGAGFDTITFVSATAGVTARLDGFQSSNFGDAAGDTYVNIENIIGTTFNDLLVGDDLNNVLSGNDEGDFLFGAGGDDTLKGGRGADALNGGAGRDAADYSDAFAGVLVDLSGAQAGVNESAGDSFVSIEDVNGSGFSDFLIGDGGDNILRGGFGDDTLFGQVGSDVLFGAQGVDILNGGAGSDVFFYAESAGVSFQDEDIIQDFDALDDAEDLLFADFLSGVFQFLGAHTNAFTSSGNTQARFNDTSKLLELDMDGDGTGDFELTLQGVALSNLDVNDFTFI
ncbi:MAG: calcium-binding protein [Pseudomonadota bacterium]